ncbi:hypothetical protein NC653_010177 [Populus alba x Populus x berolinensis]|uniref:Uncharacterized protein n=1 Tax=Populus alba x Populus x berolinensis TaxID=444605 RepID=A0AAD6QZ65_9ROSI|nr:hypothetical protein NC653_010177 [Populus alba x Populus x berolinensis]
MRGKESFPSITVNSSKRWNETLLMEIPAAQKRSIFGEKKTPRGRRKLNIPVGFEEGNMGYDYDLGTIWCVLVGRFKAILVASWTASLSFLSIVMNQDDTEKAKLVNSIS